MRDRIEGLGLDVEALASRHAPELAGYPSEISVAPGERIEFMVSSGSGPVNASIVRIYHGDEHPDSPGACSEPVAWDGAGSYAAGVQTVRSGSFLHVPSAAPLAVDAGFTLSLWFLPTVVEATTAAGLVAQLAPGDRERLWGVRLDGADGLLVEIGGVRLRLPARLTARTWHWLGVRCSAADGVRCELRRAGREQPLATADGPATPPAGQPGSLLLAAWELLDTDGRAPRAGGLYNGKLERPRLLRSCVDDAGLAALREQDELPAALDRELALDLDLGSHVGYRRVRDLSPHRLDAHLVNGPLQGATGRRWSGRHASPSCAPHEWGAAHFHEDDLDDADWEPTIALTIPDDWESGVYGLRLRAGAAEDLLPFVVRPPRRPRGRPPVALMLSTLTYWAYANVRYEGETNPPAFPAEFGPADALLRRHLEWGLSTYDRHRDQSPCCLSSRLRPIPSMHPHYRYPLVRAPRHLGADLYIVHWLTQLGQPFDVICDEDVHRDGAELLANYRVVLTGGHPEYVTAPQLAALEHHVDHGGRLMYLGGNGFYWVATLDPERGHAVEVRRGHAGTRVWDNEPGEDHHQHTGEPGGLWRYRGRAPHRWLGVGFTAEGWDGRNRRYHRSEASYRPENAFAFEGIGDEPIGDAGLVMGGAAGDELDRADSFHGTPADTVVLASSGDHGPTYIENFEDLSCSVDDARGQRAARVRADIALRRPEGGGAVFSVGSISYTASLSHAGYDNPVARLTTNVLRAFLDDDLPQGGA